MNKRLQKSRIRTVYIRISATKRKQRKYFLRTSLLVFTTNSHWFWIVVATTPFCRDVGRQRRVLWETLEQIFCDNNKNKWYKWNIPASNKAYTWHFCFVDARNREEKSLCDFAEATQKEQHGPRNRPLMKPLSMQSPIARHKLCFSVAAAF